MPFIGVIAKENDCNFIKNEITKNAKINKFDIININKNSLENVKNIKFDILVVNEDIEELINNSKYLENIIDKSCYVIINSDVKRNLAVINSININIITYGFNEKATITISSIKEENTMICVQRNIKRNNGNIIEEQEVIIKIKRNNIKKLYNVLVIFTILEIYGEKLKKI